MSTDARAGLRIHAFNLKALRHLEWAPTGVCALVGPNGSGKSTALRLIDMLRRSIEVGFAEGLQCFGPGPLKDLDAPEREAVRITVELDAATWSLAVSGGQHVQESATSGELFLQKGHAGTVMATKGTSSAAIPSELGEPMLRAVHRRTGAAGALPTLASFLARSRFYGRPQLEHLRDAGSSIGNDTTLDDGAKNLFTVLRNWRDMSEHEHRGDFVVQRMAEIFPRQFRRLDFATVGQRTTATVVTPKWATKLLPTDWSEGFFCSLALLTAIASVDDEGIVALDEPENSLHPGLIAQLVEAMRMWSKQRKVTVLMATHSPVVLDQFKEDPENVFVMQPGKGTLPVQLDSLKKREWLKHFSIGDIYSHLEVGAPIP